MVASDVAASLDHTSDDREIEVVPRESCDSVL